MADFEGISLSDISKDVLLKYQEAVIIIPQSQDYMWEAPIPLKSSVMQILRKPGNIARGTRKVLKSFTRIMIVKNH